LPKSPREKKIEVEPEQIVEQVFVCGKKTGCDILGKAANCQGIYGSGQQNCLQYRLESLATFLLRRCGVPAFATVEDGVISMMRVSAISISLSAAVLLALPSLSSQVPVKPLTVEAIYSQWPQIGTTPEGLAWSPDGKRLTYLDDGQLVEVNLSTAQQHVLVSPSKIGAVTGANTSETDRDHRERYKMASYLWAPDSAHLLFDADGQLWLYDSHTGTGIEIASTKAASGDDPKFSPDGKSISYVRDHGLFVVLLKSTKATRRVTGTPGTTTLSGEVDWVYLEELGTRSNYFWSPDSRRLAYLEMNESAVTEYPITDWIPRHATVEKQRYPQPGELNPAVRVGVISARGGKTVWIKLPIREGQDYIPRFGWVDSRTLWIETLTRDHKHRDLYFADAATGAARPVLQISDDKFVDENYDLSVEDGAVVLNHWGDGHNHLYLYSYNQSSPMAASVKLERQLTSGDFDTSDVYRVDVDGKMVYFASNEGNPLEQQLWQVNFAGERKRLSVGAGNHAASFAPSGSAFVDTYSTRLDTPVMQYCQNAGQCKVFWQTHALEPFKLRAPEQLTVKGHDGTTLYATLLLPQGVTDRSSVPLIVNPYGGPGAQEVANVWMKNQQLFDELLTQHGFAVLRADNRGMGSRGRAFAQAAWHNFGAVQLEDQLTVIDAALAQYPQLDAKRLGWWGWSWGGSFTLYAMSHSDRFRAGVAVAPVTDWRNYDTIYTERYLGTPQESAAVYEEFSAANSASRLKGRLMLVHGTGDDNVHMENTIQYVQKLIDADLPYELNIFPRKTHEIAGKEARIHLFNSIVEHFEQYLKPSVAAASGQ
jgi:dipeptidyl-peptidase 4